MSVERLGGGGGSPARLLVLAWALVAVAGLLALRGGDPTRDLAENDSDVRPAPETTLVRRAPSSLDEVRARLGTQWGGTFDELAAGLALPVQERLEDDDANPVRDSAGRIVGFVWDDAAHVDTPGSGAAAGSWLLSVEVMRRAPWRHAYPCAPERWGMPGAAVVSCEVRAGDDWQRVTATSVQDDAGLDDGGLDDGGLDDGALDDGGAGPGAAGWTYTADVREGLVHVQMLLTRREAGTDPPPLTLSDLERLAVDPAWREE